MSSRDQKTDKDRQMAQLNDDDLLALVKSGSIIHSSLDSKQVFSMIMENTNKVAGSVASTLFLLDEETGELIFSTPTGPMAAKLADQRIKKGQGIAGWVVEHGEPAIVPDVSQDARFFDGIDDTTGFQTKSVLCVPLLLKGQPIGALEAINKQDGSSFTEKDALLLSAFAEQTVMAVENARLHGALERQLKETLRLQDCLTEAEKNLALQKLSAGIAHDFKNILNAISGFAEIVHLETKNDKTREDIGEVLKATGSATDLVEQILAFTQQSPHRKTTVKSKKCFKQAIKLFRIFLPQNVQIHENLSFDDGPLHANSTQIHHAITHIFKNARDAIDQDQGIISVESAMVELDKIEASLHTGLKPGPYVRLTVTDDGCGMDAETLKQVFDPYFTTKKRRVGTGMGLPAVQGIVKDHGGTISITSEPDQGTRVEILLPKKDVVEPAARVLSLDTLPGGIEHILVVDDELIMANTLKKMLQSLGYRVTTTNSSTEALEVFEADPADIDLVLTDWAMPAITGDRLAEKMIARKADTKVILFSAFDDGITKENFDPKSIRRVLKKPISMEVLAFTLRQVLDTPNEE
jgi:signal transduction histidine kinase